MIGRRIIRDYEEGKVDYFDMTQTTGYMSDFEKESEEYGVFVENERVEHITKSAGYIQGSLKMETKFQIIPAYDDEEPKYVYVTTFHWQCFETFDTRPFR